MGCSLKRWKGVSIVNAFQNFVKEANRKPKEVNFLDKGSEFYNNSFKKMVKIQ